MSFENEIKQAFPTVKVPEALLARTLAREKAVMIGRRAETSLKNSEFVSKSQQDKQMAQAMVGRLALITEMTQDPEKLVDALQQNKQFQEFTKEPLDKQLKEVANGHFLGTMVSSKSEIAKETRKPAKQEVKQQEGRKL